MIGPGIEPRALQITDCTPRAKDRCSSATDLHREGAQGIKGAEGIKGGSGGDQGRERRGESKLEFNHEFIN